MAPAGRVQTEASSSSPSLPSSSSLDSGLLDRGYPCSRSALLKGAQMLLLLIGFICIRASWWTDHSTYSFFEIVSICDLVMILIFYIVYIFRIYRTLTCINWPLAAFGFLASFLCILSIWLSYKVSCVTQSTDTAV